ncbi:hypothetical protein [Glycomyces xiaoerkulensis]|uniref:hypothetical protein n=1 Tax=Glycomyces xiaoerkulensis TaxID=2038139 RepID=UPI0013000EF8|nr:hypothetical protein [Glycomyces xiaoerkulensis]
MNNGDSGKSEGVGLLGLEPGAVLLHIGPTKTGTTAIQHALHNARGELAGHGVFLPARTRHPMNVFGVAAGRRPQAGDPERLLSKWQEISAATCAASDRISVLSGELFGDADDEFARRLVDDLGGAERVHVLITCRSLPGLLASQWQQYVQNGVRNSYDDWLTGMLREIPYDKPTPSFWRRHRYDRLASRWSEVVGADRVSVLVVDNSQPEGLPKDFESLLGLPEGVLEVSQDSGNRSLTWGEIEAVRQLYIIAKDPKIAGRTKVDTNILRHKIIPRFQRAHRPGADEPRIVTPDWALDEAAAVGEEIAAGLTESGLRVIGDPALLSRRPSRPQTERPERPMVSSEAVAKLMFESLVEATDRPRRRPRPTIPKQSPPPVEDKVERRFERLVKRFLGRFASKA